MSRKQFKKTLKLKTNSVKKNTNKYKHIRDQKHNQTY